MQEGNNMRYVLLISVLLVASVGVFIWYQQNETNQYVSSSDPINGDEQEMNQVVNEQINEPSTVTLSQERLAEDSGTKRWGWTTPVAVSPDLTVLAEVKAIKDERTSTHTNWLVLTDLDTSLQRHIYLNRTHPNNTRRSPRTVLGWNESGTEVIITAGFEPFGEMVAEPIELPDIPGREKLYSSDWWRDDVVPVESQPNMRGFGAQRVNIHTGEIIPVRGAGPVFDFNPRTQVLLVDATVRRQSVGSGVLTKVDTQGVVTLKVVSTKKDEPAVSVDVQLEDGEYVYEAQTSWDSEFIALIIRKTDNAAASRIMFIDMETGRMGVLPSGHTEFGGLELPLEGTELSIDHWYYNSVFRYFRVEDQERIEMRASPVPVLFYTGEYEVLVKEVRAPSADDKPYRITVDPVRLKSEDTEDGFTNRFEKNVHLELAPDAAITIQRSGADTLETVTPELLVERFGSDEESITGVVYRVQVEDKVVSSLEIIQSTETK